MSDSALNSSAVFTAPGFEKVAAVFDAQLARALHFGAQLCVRLQGRTVVERHGGYADSTRSRLVEASTPFMVYSTTKAFTAVCVHKLADEGKLALDEAVALYWPEFSKHGKEGITVRHLLTHQAGLLVAANLADILSWPVPGAPARRVAALKPAYEPGSRTVYHMFTASVALGELIRRVSGLKPARYLAENFLEPLGMTDSFAGLPFREYSRASRIYSADVRQNLAARVFSNPLYRSIYLPAASLNTTAHDIAVFYEMLRSGGTSDGNRYLSERAVEEAAAIRYEGPDGDSGLTVRWASGFGLGGYSPFPDKDIRHMGLGATAKTFGHSGQGGCGFGWADRASGLVFGFTCNRFLELEAAHLRFQELANACWESVGIQKRQ